MYQLLIRFSSEYGIALTTASFADPQAAETAARRLERLANHYVVRLY